MEVGESDMCDCDVKDAAGMENKSGFFIPCTVALGGHPTQINCRSSVGTNRANSSSEQITGSPPEMLSVWRGSGENPGARACDTYR
jgi:hypothetical protein